MESRKRIDLLIMEIHNFLIMEIHNWNMEDQNWIWISMINHDIDMHDSGMDTLIFENYLQLNYGYPWLNGWKEHDKADTSCSASGGLWCSSKYWSNLRILCNSSVAGESQLQSESVIWMTILACASVSQSTQTAKLVGPILVQCWDDITHVWPTFPPLPSDCFLLLLQNP